MTDTRRHPLRRSRQDMEAANRIPDTPQTRAPAYRLAFTDKDFMTREELRPTSSIRPTTPRGLTTGMPMATPWLLPAAR